MLLLELCVMSYLLEKLKAVFIHQLFIECFLCQALCQNWGMKEHALKWEERNT